MKLNADRIQFEYVYEVNNILKALYEYQRTNDENSVVEELIRHLEYLQMCW